MKWYQVSAKEVLQKLATSESGLTSEEAKKRFIQYGPNKLAEEEKISRFKILLHQFTSPLIYILLIAGLVTVLLKEYIDSGVIFAVVILNAIIGYVQEYKAEESVRALKKMVVPKGTAVVNGRAKGVVVETGVTTILGNIAKEVKKIRMVKAPLQEKIHGFAKTIGFIVL